MKIHNKGPLISDYQNYDEGDIFCFGDQLGRIASIVPNTVNEDEMVAWIETFRVVYDTTNPDLFSLEFLRLDDYSVNEDEYADPTLEFVVWAKGNKEEIIKQIFIARLGALP